MPNPNISEEDFRKLSVALAEEAQSARIDYKMYQDLVNAASEYEIVIQQSRAFWTMTVQALLNSAILRLCRIYDQQKSSMNLARWLKIIKHNQNWFKEPLDLARLEHDIAYASNTNPLVKNLTKYRGNVVAHMGENYVLDIHSTRKSFKLTYGNLKELFQSALDTVNHYTTAHIGHSWSPNLVGADDFTFIFRRLKDSIEQSRAEQEAEIEKYRNRQS